MLDRRIGKFQIDLDLMDRDPETCRFILRDVLILGASCVDGSAVDYIGIHPGFEFVPVGCDVPTYSAEITNTGRATVVRWDQRAPWPERRTVPETNNAPPPPPPPPVQFDEPVQFDKEAYREAQMGQAEARAKQRLAEAMRPPEGPASPVYGWGWEEPNPEAAVRRNPCRKTRM